MIGRLREYLYRMRGRNRYANFREVLLLQKLPTDELRQRQFWRLSSLLHHAYKTVPYYRRVFERMHITPDDIRSFADFEAFPLLSRQEIQENLTELLSSSILENMRYLNFSGGTMGEPIKFYQDLRLRESMEANWLLCLSFAGWTPSDMVVNIWGNPRDTGSGVVKKGLRTWLAGQLHLNAYKYNKSDLENWLAAIARYRRVFIYAYVSVITDLAEYVLETKRKVGNVQAVITTAERLHDQQRETIRAAFACRVHDQYGSREVPGVASECEQGNMHLLTHSAYTEFLPMNSAASEDNPELADAAVPGQEDAHPLSRLVLTNLTNLAMPLIRYEVGDYGAPQEGSCPCGRGFPLMHMGIGRLGGSLVTPGGTRLYSTFFVRQMYGMDGVTSFQFRQKKPEEVYLYVVRGKRFSEITSRKLQELQARFAQEICPGMNLLVEYVDDLPRTVGGKHRHVICEVPQ